MRRLRYSGALMLACTVAMAAPTAQASAPGEDERSELQAPPRKIGPLGIAGASIAGGGLLLVVPGAVFLHRGEEVEPMGAIQEVTDFRPLGAALIASGASLALVGTVLFAVDLSRRARARRTVRSRLSLSPSFGRRAHGLVLTGRF